MARSRELGFIACLLLLSSMNAIGCRSSREVVIEIPSGRSAISIDSDTTLIDTPELELMPLFDLGLSLPLEVERFRSLRAGRSVAVQRLTIDRRAEDREFVDIETPSGRYRFQLPARGERLTIGNRADSLESDSLMGSVTGEARPERYSVEIEDPNTMADRWLRLVKWIALLVVLVIALLLVVQFRR